MEELNPEESGTFRPGRTLPLEISDFQNDGTKSISDWKRVTFPTSTPKSGYKRRWKDDELN